MYCDWRRRVVFSSSTARSPRTRCGTAFHGPVQQQIIDKRLRFFVIDASSVAREVGLGVRTNTVLQTCFFAISGVLPRERAMQHIKEAIRKTYAGKGEAVVRKNYTAVDATLEQLQEVQVPPTATNVIDRSPIVPDDAPDFVRRVTAAMMMGRGDEIPVSLLPSDGTFPSGTAAWEKRNISDIVAVWEPELCIQCGQCAFVCPHSVIRAKYFHEDKLDGGARLVQVRAGQRPRLSGSALYTAVLRRGLHGLWPLRRGLPGCEPPRSGREGRQYGRKDASSRRRAEQHRVLRAIAGERPFPGRLRQCPRRAVSRAAVRILRRLRRLRRDAVPQAALAIVRRPAPDRQRYRLLLDLWRQPPGHALGQEWRGAGAGMVELSV